MIDVVIYIDGRKRQAGKKTLSGSSFFLLLDYSEIDEILRLQYSIQVVLVSYPESVIRGVNCGLEGEEKKTDHFLLARHFWHCIPQNCIDLLFSLNQFLFVFIFPELHSL